MLPFLAKQSGLEFDKFATGHYARIEEREGRFILKRAKNPKKDQSYFLYKLKQEQLKNIYLPLGEYTKNIQKKKSEKLLEKAVLMFQKNLTVRIFMKEIITNFWELKLKKVILLI